MDDKARHVTTTALNGHHEHGSETHSCYFFISDHGAKQVQKFQYAGEDRSLLYKYVLSPLASFLVARCTPAWLAPNVITLTALMVSATSYVIMWRYYDSATEWSDVPSWVLFFSGVSLLVHQTLDNMDGKQARRTNSSSPLGLLFDHGCDAIHLGFFIPNWICCLGLFPDEELWFFLGMSATMGFFYFSTWEEYYTRTMILPRINGPNEGVWIGTLMTFISGIWGIQYWHQTDWMDFFLRQTTAASWISDKDESFLWLLRIRNCDVVMGTLALAALVEWTGKVRTVVGKHGRSALTTLLPFAVLWMAPLAMHLFDPTLFRRNPRTCLHLWNALFVESVTQMQLDLIAQQPFRVAARSWILAPLVLGTLISSRTTVDPDTADACLLSYAVACIVYLCLKMRLVVWELCHILNTNCFVLSRP